MRESFFDQIEALTREVGRDLSQNTSAFRLVVERWMKISPAVHGAMTDGPTLVEVVRPIVEENLSTGFPLWTSKKHAEGEEFTRRGKSLQLLLYGAIYVGDRGVRITQPIESASLVRSGWVGTAVAVAVAYMLSKLTGDGSNLSDLLYAMAISATFSFSALSIFATLSWRDEQSARHKNAQRVLREAEALDRIMQSLKEEN